MAGHKTTLEQWRILQAVVDHGGYAHAAVALHRSQSSLNHAVKKLEHQLGVEMLEVKGRKAFLTEAGEALLRRSRILTETAEGLEKLAENIDMGWEPLLTISVEAIYPRELLFRALSRFYPDSRGTRIRIIDTVLTGSIEQIVNNRVDLAITGHVPKGYTYEELCRVEFILVTHRNHELAALGHNLTQQELVKQMQVVIKDTAQKPLEAQGWLKSDQRWTVDSFERAKQVLKHGLGFCWLPRHEILQELASGEFVALEVDFSSMRTGTVSLVVPEPDVLGPGGKRLYDILMAEGCTANCKKHLQSIGVNIQT